MVIASRIEDGQEVALEAYAEQRPQPGSIIKRPNDSCLDPKLQGGRSRGFHEFLCQSIGGTSNCQAERPGRRRRRNLRDGLTWSRAIGRAHLRGGILFHGNRICSPEREGGDSNGRIRRRLGWITCR
jgi:hypothetical protein